MKRKLRFPLLRFYTVYESDTYMVFAVEGRLETHGIEIVRIAADGGRRVAYVQGAQVWAMAEAAADWAMNPPPTCMIEEYLEMSMQFAPQYPLNTH